MTDTLSGPAGGQPAASAPYVLPASFAQERLWFVSQLVPDLGVYNLGCPFELAELGRDVNVDRFEAAFAAVTARHETLRTCLDMRDGELVQLVYPAVRIDLERTDLSGLDPVRRAAREAEITIRDAATPIPLDRAPMWRARLIRRAADDWLFVLVVHHAVCDAWSVRNFATELYHAYHSLASGSMSGLPELSIQYGDFAAWQRARMTGGELDDQMAYWQRALAGLPAPLRLPALAGGRERGISPDRGGATSFAFPAGIRQQTEKLARACGTTPFAIMLSAFAALLSRLTGQQDLLIGSPVSGRTRPELTPLIGMFVNTLVLRVDCSGDPGFRQLVGRVRDTLLDALDHQEVPYDRLVEVLAPDRNAAGQPLHQVVFNLLPLATNTQIRNGTAKADLLIDLAEEGDGYEGRMEYRRALFDAAEADAFASRFGRLLAAALADPDTRVARLPLLDPAERQGILAAAAPGHPRPAPPEVITDMFAAHAAARPDSPAVADAAGRTLSYRELDERANQLARHLRAMATVGPDTPVALLLETNATLAVAVLAVLKAGAAYLPLDQQHPAGRMRYLIEDAGVVAVITDAASAGLLPATGIPVIDIDAAAGTIGRLPAGPLAVRPHPDSLAYVIYTSGSTGQPKGVGVAHRQVAAYADEIRPLLAGGEPGQVFAMLQPLTFDFSATMFYGALLTGGTLHVTSRDLAADAHWVSEHLRRDQVDYVKITPSHLLALQAGPIGPAALLPRRALILGGEASRWDWVRSLRAARPGCAVINHYGPTETTVGALALPGEEEPVTDGPVTPVGWPLPHARAYILDERLEPVPDGVPGELCLGGITVTRGYLGRPALTASRFLPDPFAGVSGARLYRTGDRARRLPGGAVEFLGRVDDQVKIRGYRVEPGEVQHVLAAAPDVADCVVVVHYAAGQPGAQGTDPQLVAYFVPAAGEPDTAALREFAAQRLPEYMIPTFFVPMAELPLAAHGKVDRSKLPSPAAETKDESAEAPRGATEDLVAGLFERLLGREAVGRSDVFFALGGHSLLAIQLVTRLRAAFGVAIPLRDVFKDPTVAGIAAQIEAKLAGRGRQLPPVCPVPHDGELSASYIQRRLWFLDQLEPGGALYNTSICLRVSGELDPDALHRAIEGVAERHEVLRTVFLPRDDELVQVVRDEPEVPFTIADLTAADSGTDPLPAARELLAEQAGRRFDLAAGPPLRVLLVRLRPASHLLLITLHHVVNDAWSAGLLTRELAELYAALRQGRPPELPELPVQYADFAAWQRQLVADELRDSQLAYWRDRLADLPERLELPTDRPRPAREGHDGAHALLRVPAGLTDRLRALGADENASLFMVLLAGFLVLLGRYTGQDDLAVGTPTASRPLPEFEPLLGCFLNTLVLRTDCSGEPSFRELVRRVRDTSLEALANQDIPFEALVEELRPRRELASTPLFQALFTLEDAERETVTSDGIELRWEPFGSAIARFDITLYLWRRPDGLSGAVEYRTDSFDAGTMERFAEHYTTLLTAAAADPDRAAARLPMLSQDDQDLVVGWNATGVGWRGAGVLPVLVAEQAVRSAGAVALVSEAGVVSYGEFVAGVNRLARYLAGTGVAAGDVVGVLLERGPELVTAVHAVQAAGAAYLPLDPQSPPARLGYMCATAGAARVVTTAALAGLLDGPGMPAPVLLDGAAGQIAALPASPLPVTITPDALAYVIFTSGSTGQPKGVAVSHAAITNRLRWMQQALPLDAADRVAHKTPAGFDVSVWELFWPLITGAAMVIAAPGGHRDTGYLATLFAAEQVTVSHFVPSLLDAFLDEPGLAGRLPGLRQVICSGEALAPALAGRFHTVLPHAELHNLYGPTEAAVDVTWHQCQPGEDPLPIGRPVANTRIHIHDRAGQPVPVGVPGELCIAGAQLAAGYIGRPALTAAAFTPDPHGPPGSRLYHTGDLARWLPTGEIDYLGRTDQQVKIRGIRVEPGEIEAALASCPGVRAAVVHAWPHPAGPRLAAYLIAADPTTPPDPTQLPTQLATTLPAHMIPTSYHILDTLPLTPSGKLNRNALPPPTNPTPTTSHELPATEAERAVAHIWAEVLGADRVGAHDDFFALGGDSIRTLKVIARLREAGYAAELQQLFQHQTVRALAAVLRRGAAEPRPQAAPFELLDPAAAARTRSIGQAEDGYPLTALQAGMVFHSEYEESGATYHDVFTVRVAGEYRGAALDGALAEVTARHPVLRTSFHIADFDNPVQIVHATAAAPVTEADLSSAGQAEVPGLIAAFQDQEKRNGFAMDTAPLLRVFVHRLPGAEFALTLSFHHAILDGWSVATLTTELLRRYAAQLAGSPLPVAALPVSYRDFVAAERAAVAAPEAAAYWRAVTADAPVTALPRLPGAGPDAASPARAAAPGDAAVVLGTLALGLAARLEDVARSTQVPLRSVLLAAHLRVLALLSGNADVVTGVVTHSRPQHEAGGQVLGLYLNTIPVRVDTGQRSWAELVRAVFDAEVAALPHRMYPLLEIQRVTGRSPLFEALFDYRDFHVYDDLPAGDELRVAGYWFFEQTNLPFAANFIRSPADGSLTLQLKFDSRLYQRAQIKHVRDLYLRALEALAGAPDSNPRPAAAYLREDTARIGQWNGTGRDYPAGTLPELIAAQAARTPDAPALWAGGTELSYGQLAHRVRALAARLTRHGVTAGDVVGVCLERSAALVEAVHAIGAAGAAYLPLEPDHPPQRLAFMAADAGAAVVITTSALAGRVPGARTLCLDTGDSGTGASDTEDSGAEDLDGRANRPGARPPGTAVHPDALAYVIYTSGSTGQPKGVGVSHRAIANRLRWMQENFPLGPGDRVLHKTPFSFDVSVWELFWPLLAGASIVVADPGGQRVPGYLRRLAREQRLTVAHFVPSMLDALLEEPGLGDDLATLRWVICSGEALAAALAGRFHAALPHAELHNLYGPTEAAVDVTWHPCRPGDPVIPIGRPVANTRIEILDAAGERVPVGVPGELCIGGVQLARGYVGRPALTADRFVPDRHGPPGGRLYRAGDLARWLPGGEIEYLGRIDHQVKVHGFRIELGEIEAALAAEPGVRAAVVTARTDHLGDRRLVAYVVPEAADGVTSAQLADRLRGRLPGYMVPAAYVMLAELPLTHNGKLDRAALPEPDPRGETPYEEPAVGAERAVAAAWAEVLGIARIGAHDDFFALGGDSIRSLKVIARLRQNGYELGTGQLFAHPTVRELASVLGEAGTQPAPVAKSAAFGLVSAEDLAVLQRQFEGGQQ